MAKGQTPPNVTGKSNAPTSVPEYVVKYAPLVYLHPDEKYFPSDITAQLTNTTPKQEFNAIVSGVPSPLTLDNLDQLNKLGSNGTNIYLTSNEDVSKTPKWLTGVLPVDGKTNDAKSCAVIVVDKGNGTVDAFYMYFYAFNWGGIAVGKNLGNHVGDWEHTMVRFLNGVPQAVWLSQHSGGQAFKYSTLNKDKSGIRPIVFSANGSHANYAIQGLHNHDFPGEIHLGTPGFANDFTGYGPLWDPTQSAYWYSWTNPSPTPNNVTSPTRNTSKLGTFTAYDPATSPIGFMYFTGRWGDFRYKVNDPRQDSLLFQVWKYDSGPTGPAYKNLQRKNVWSTGNGQLLTELIP